MFLKAENILLDINEDNKYEAIRKIIFSSETDEGLKEEAYRVVKEREEVQSTSVGKGIGIAHGRLGEVEKLKILMGISKKGINYDSYDGKDVNIIFVILTEKSRTEEYLCTLSKLSKICRNEKIKKEIIKADNKERILFLVNSSLGYC